MKAFRKQIFQNKIISFETYSESIDITHCHGYSFHGVWENLTPSAFTLSPVNVNTSTSTFTKVSHGFAGGVVGRFTSTSALPAGLAVLTDYFVIPTSPDTFQVASSLVNALNGVPVTVSSGGVGVHTFTSTLLEGSVKLQGSIDGLVFTDVSDGSTALSALAAFINVPTVYYPFVRIAVSPSAGAVKITAEFFAKGGA